MSKKIRVVIEMIIELPDNAEVIRFTDEEGYAEDYIKFAGKLIRPDVSWMEYLSSDLTAKKYKGGGIGWESIPERLHNEYFASPEQWSMKEQLKCFR
jgi:hypothetical protein